MNEIKLVFDLRKISPEKIKQLVVELEKVATVNENNIIFDDAESEKVMEILDNYFINNQQSLY